MLKELWKHLSRRRRIQFWFLLFIMIMASFLEVVSVGMVIPFLSVMTEPDQVYQHSLIQPLIQVLGITDSSQLMLPITIIFVIVALFSGVVRLVLLYVMTRISYATGADLSIDIYRRTLYQDYLTHLSRNSSEVINSITSKTNTVIGGVINPVLSLISGVVLIVSIMGALLVINTVVALLSFFGFGILYWLVIYYTKNQLKGNSICIAEQSTVMIKSLQEGLGGIRDVLIDNSQEFYCKLYQDADAPFRRATGGNIVISGSPRLVMESIGIALIAILAYIMSLQPEGIISTLPVLGALALGAQRLLPALQQVYGSYTTIKGSHSSFLDVLELLDMKLPNFYGKPLPAFIPFAKGIELKGICFRYTEDSPWILKDVNLKINKGMCVGFIGVTGSGKSTLLDIIMGLISPTSGEIFIDGQRIFNENNISWRRHISHVPQHIYLSDNTIEENIAFGKSRGKINHQLVRKAAQKAQISKLIEGWKDGYNTIVGENGVRLSGGQRQRIGIARAFYKQADMLIFDEATSALDNETERDIMKTIDGLENGITILIIAHRLTTLKECDQIIKLDKGKAIHIGGYQDINKDILKK